MRIKSLYFLFVLLMLTISSCGSSKKAYRQAKVSNVASFIESSNSMSVLKDYLKTETSNLSEGLQIVITEYDTAQPVDSATGKPPVKKEIKVDKRKEAKKESKEEESEKLENMSSMAEQVEIQDSVYIEEVKENKETTLPQQSRKLVYSVCILIGLLIIWWLVRRFSRK